MIEAKPNRMAQFIFRHYIMRLMKRHFHSVQLFGDVPNSNSALPMILVSNHSSWWDGFFVYLINEKIFKRPVYLMMLERQLSKYRFFSRVGAYGIDPENPKSIIASLKYTVRLMQRISDPSPIICIFPQGELLSWGKRPLNFKRGIDKIIEQYHHDVEIVLLAMRIEFMNDQRADVFFQFGNPMICNRTHKVDASLLERIMAELLDQLERQILENKNGLILFDGTASIHAKIDTFFNRTSLITS